MAALKADLHIYCDKPLAATASMAKTFYQKSAAVGVKTHRIGLLQFDGSQLVL